MQRRDFSRCPRCGSATQSCTAINGGPSEFWVECTSPTCNTYINTYVPLPHQEAVHKDGHYYVGNFGGYGTGKTTTSREEFYKHAFITPKGNTLIGAQITSQYEQTIKRDIEKDMPAAFVAAYSTQKQYMDLINAHRVMYRPLDDDKKLRSYNLSMFVIVEASEVDGEIFTQLKTRLRSSAAIIPKLDENGDIIYRPLSETNGVLIPEEDKNWSKGIVESNPDPGWIKSHVLEMSSDIQKHGNAMDDTVVIPDLADPAISSHISTSDANPYLPKDFKANLSKNKPLWWTARYLYGSFSYAEGLVYPSAMKSVCDYFQPPKHWLRICAFDYGLSDDAVYLFGAISPEENVLYIYKEVILNDRSLRELADAFHENTRDILPGNWVCPPIIDPKSGPKRDYDKESLSEKFLEYGIAFKPGYVNINTRVFALNTYFEAGRIKIMQNCQYLIDELKKYKFKERSLTDTNYDDKPVDKNNHAINPLEWIVMELPKDPANLSRGVYDKHGYNLEDPTKNKIKQRSFALHALSEDDTEFGGSGPFDMADF